MSIQQFARRLTNTTARRFSIWANVPQGPADPILGVTEAFKRDKDPKKVTLGAGTYKDDNGKPWVLESVKKATEVIRSKSLDYEYLPVEGHSPFLDAATTLAYGADSKPLKEKRIVGLQALSGTGAVRIGAEFVRRYANGAKGIYLPDVTWPNHRNIVRDAGLEVRSYKYYSPKTRGLDFDGLVNDLNALPEGQVILLHASAHNPTGVDPKQEQWVKLKDVFLKKKHLAFFDMAYQGFTSGDIHRDAFAVRTFVNNGVPIILAQSFAKNFGLYGLRTGLFSAIVDNQKEFDAVASQLKIIARPIWSSPPLTGARIVETILTNAELTALWQKEVKVMADRIANMRKSLVENLKKAGSQHNWQHITDQIGMFAYTGINQDQVKQLADKYHIYLTNDGRISIAGLNTKNVEYVAQSFHEITKNVKF